MRTRRPKCYGCGKKARKGFLFCSQRCAAIWAEELALGNEEAFFFDSEQWEGIDHYNETEEYKNRPRVSMREWSDQ